MQNACAVVLGSGPKDVMNTPKGHEVAQQSEKASAPNGSWLVDHL